MIRIDGTRFRVLRITILLNRTFFGDISNSNTYVFLVHRPNSHNLAADAVAFALVAGVGVHSDDASGAVVLAYRLVVAVGDIPTGEDIVAHPIAAEAVVAMADSVHRQYRCVFGIVASPKSYSWAHNMSGRTSCI